MHSKVILVVEDDEMMREFVATVLAMESYFILAEELESFIGICGLEDGADLIISDYKMPGMTGLEMYQTLNRGYFKSNQLVPPIIFMTGFTGK